MKNEEKILKAKEIYRESLLKRKNVIGLGKGYKEVKGEATDKLCLRVYVRKKEPANALALEDLIPSVLEVNGAEVVTDVIEVGDVEALGCGGCKELEPLEEQRQLSYTGRYRPAPGGVSLGHYLITAGTLGCVMHDRASERRVILSNWHVLAGEKALPGDPILQPGPWDGGEVETDTIGYLQTFKRIRFNGPANQLDAAIAYLRDEELVTKEILEIGSPKGVFWPRLSLKVRKTGRTSGYNEGEIVDSDAELWVSYGSGKRAYFIDQILTTKMASPGDSGSALLTAGGFLVGLIFAGSWQITVANKMVFVTKLLNIGYWDTEV